MQMFNELTIPAGLWLGRLFKDGIFCSTLATIIMIVFTIMSNQFHNLVWYALMLDIFLVTSDCLG